MGAIRETQRGDIVVLLLSQHLVAVDHARRDNLGDPPLDQLLGQLRILQLVAHSHLIAGPHQFGHVARKRMVRKPRQLDIALVPVRLAGLHDTQHLAGSHRILPVRLIEVPHPHQQQGLRTSRLDFISGVSSFSFFSLFAISSHFRFKRGKNTKIRVIAIAVLRQRACGLFILKLRTFGR